MCYDISFTVELETIADYFQGLVFDQELFVDIESTAHILGPFNYGSHGIIYRNREDNLPHMRLMNWGIIPHYLKEKDAFTAFAKKREWWLNIKSERLLDDKRSYWYQIRNRRCLVPVSGIYEHRHIKGWKNKVPYLVWPCNQPLFFLPGLYAVAEIVDPETGELTTHRTFAIITRAANSLMKMIHNGGPNAGRMPLFLPHNLASTWLQNDLSEEDYRSILNYEMPAEDLAYRTTFTIRSAKQRPDGKMKHEAWEWEKLPELGMMNPLME